MCEHFAQQIPRSRIQSKGPVDKQKSYTSGTQQRRKKQRLVPTLTVWFLMVATCVELKACSLIVVTLLMAHDDWILSMGVSKLIVVSKGEKCSMTLALVFEG